MILLCSVFFRYTKNIELDFHYLMKSFGFQKDGNYSLTIKNVYETELFFALINSSEKALVNRQRSLKKDLCSTLNGSYKGKERLYLASINHSISIKNAVNNEIFGTVKNKGVLYPVLFNCQEQKEDLLFEFNASNPKSLLDYRYQPLLKLKYFSIILFSVSTIFSLINSFCNSKNLSFYNATFSISSTLMLVSSICNICSLKFHDKSDRFSPLDPLSVSTDFFASFVLFISFLLGSTGIETLTFDVFSKDTVKGFTIASVFFVLKYVLEYVPLGVWSVFFVLLFVVVMVQLQKVIVNNFRISLYKVRVHIVSISSHGIDPQTTPVFRQLNIFKRFRYYTLVYYITIIFEILLVLLQTCFWIQTIFVDIVNGVLLIIILFEYRTHKSSSLKFSTNDAEVFLLDDITKLSENAQDYTGLKKWEPDDELPRPPHIISTKINSET